MTNQNDWIFNLADDIITKSKNPLVQEMDFLLPPSKENLLRTIETLKKQQRNVLYKKYGIYPNIFLTKKEEKIQERLLQHAISKMTSNTRIIILWPDIYGTEDDRILLENFTPITFFNLKSNNINSIKDILNLSKKELNSYNFPQEVINEILAYQKNNP